MYASVCRYILFLVSSELHNNFALKSILICFWIMVWTSN